MNDKRKIISGIYGIINKINNKLYVGQSKDILDRFIRHKCELKHNKHHNRHLQNAYNKYGLANFKFEIIEKCEQNIIDEKEVFWIDYFQSNNTSFGYNLESGGNSNKQISDETRKIMGQRISQAQMGRKLTEEWKENIRKSRIGTKRSEETKQKLSKSKKGINNINSGNFQKGHIPWNKGMSPSDETKEKIRQSLKEYNNSKKIEPTPEMIGDIKNGMTRRKFEEKYSGHQLLWRELYHKEVS